MSWICMKCGNRLGNMAAGHVSTWHNDKCDVCGADNVSVTEPRDFGIGDFQMKVGNLVGDMKKSIDSSFTRSGKAERRGLCYRCEHRARYHERGTAPRCECGTTGAVHSCYMYEPVMPCITKKVAGDRRTRHGAWMISAREEYDGVVSKKQVDILVWPLSKKRCFLYCNPKIKKKLDKDA